MPDAHYSDSLDIRTLALRYRSGVVRPRDLLAEVANRLDKYEDRAVWIHRVAADRLTAAAREVEARSARGENLPIFLSLLLLVLIL